MSPCWMMLIPQPFSALPDHQRSCAVPPLNGSPPMSAIEPLAVRSSSPKPPSTIVKVKRLPSTRPGIEYQCGVRLSGVGPYFQYAAVGGSGSGYSTTKLTDALVPQLSRRKSSRPWGNASVPGGAPSGVKSAARGSMICARAMTQPLSVENTDRVIERPVGEVNVVERVAGGGGAAAALWITGIIRVTKPKIAAIS